MSEPDYDEDDAFEVGFDDGGFECGAWIDGKFDYYHCQLAGTEECDWECPSSRAVRILGD